MVRYDLHLFEVWKQIPGFPEYEVSSEGRVWSNKTNRFMKEFPNDKGYLRVRIGGKSVAVARIVCQVFNYNPNPEIFNEVNHINEDKSDNRSCNLEWCDRKYNVNYGDRMKKQYQTCYDRGIWNPEYVGLSEKDRRRKYKLDHKEQCKIYKKKSYLKNRDHYLEYYKNWRQNKKKNYAY